HLGTVKDVTEQKRLSEQLIISERLAVVGELVAGVAHEVRNPLFGITTTLSALERKLEDRQALAPFLKVVMAEVDHLNHLMEQLLEHSRPIRLDSKSIDVRDLVREVVDEFGDQPRARGVDVSIVCEGPVPGLHLDRRKMHGVFANLIDNALQHTRQGGRIQVVIRSMPELAGDVGEGVGGARSVRLEVKDTGAGIAAEDLGKVFDPFFTTRATGTGLGLAIARKTVHDHGGTIDVDSSPGEGTSFTITLPLSHASG
ncbi:MAG TPA: ATP-binding protein, partial [Blastocatellia bacterium]|nr:ATP-binding protein [Blastocatellia bacterium]